jgi:2-oxoglutarate dehydrogenase E2 component (dihydrolipoamide succinyltransferase)
VNSPEQGKIVQLFAKEGDTVSVGGDLLQVEIGDFPDTSAPSVTKEAPSQEVVTPVVTPAAPLAAPLADVTPKVAPAPVAAPKVAVAQAPKVAPAAVKMQVGERGETRVFKTI